jgi:hypothetical protein
MQLPHSLHAWLRLQRFQPREILREMELQRRPWLIPVSLAACGMPPSTWFEHLLLAFDRCFIWFSKPRQMPNFEFSFQWSDPD